MDIGFLVKKWSYSDVILLRHKLIDNWDNAKLYHNLTIEHLTRVLGSTAT